MNRSPSRPFGLRFEEFPVANDFTPPMYDEDEDISVYIDRNGQKIASVEYYRGLGTKTATSVQDEGTDEDESPDSLKMDATRTFTKIQSETSDSDDASSLILGTKTETFIQSEQSDEDPAIDAALTSKPPKPLPTTKTFTNVVRENTDQD